LAGRANTGAPGIDRKSHDWTNAIHSGKNGEEHGDPVVTDIAAYVSGVSKDEHHCASS
jgi:hypothetical protein